MLQLRSAIFGRHGWALGIVPVLLLLVAALVAAIVGRGEVDPDYAYLFNGLEILTLYPPSYFDHPGTTLEVLAAAVIFITWLISIPVLGFAGLVTSVATRPDMYLHAINQVLVVIIAGACFAMARQVQAATKGLLAPLVAQASLLLSFAVSVCLYRVTPEPLMLAATLVLIAVLTPIVFRSEPVSRRHAALLGVAIGFCIVTKITALPLVFTLLLLEDGKLRKTATIWLVASGLLLSLPIWHHYPAMLGWFLRVFSHSGQYGSGAVGAPSAQNLWANLLTLIGLVPEIFAAVIVYAVVFLLWPASRVRRLMAVSVIILCAQIVMVIKQPSARYLLPSVAIMALANAGLVWDFWARRAAVLKAVLVALFAAGIAHNAWATSAWAQEYSRVSAGNALLIARAQRSGCAVIPYYEVATPGYGVEFGNYYTHYHFTAQLQRLSPTAVTYDPSLNAFRRGFSGTRMAPADLRTFFASARCVTMLGLKLEGFGPSPFKPGSLSILGRPPYGNQNGLTLYEVHLDKLELAP